MSKTSRRVVITGMGVSSPAGYTLEENIAAWREGRPTFREITTFVTAGSSVRYAGECPPPEVKRLPDRKVQKILRRKDVISLLTTLETARHGRLEKGTFDPERVGMYVGAGATQIGDLTPYFELVMQCVDLPKGVFDSTAFGSQLMSLVNPLVVLQTLMNNALCFGSMTLDLRGVNSNFMDFSTAGLRAIGEAFLSIRHDRADAAIAGGVAGPVEPFQLAEGVHSGYLATTKDLKVPIERVVRPWDRTREGAILSEGSAYVLIEEEGHALRRGATILGRIEGFGLAADGTFDFMTESTSPGLVRSMALALDQAGLGRADIGCIVGHGSGSVHGDRAEGTAYQEFLGDKRGGVPITSCKSVLGDMGEAGSAVSVLQAVDILGRRSVPPTVNFHAADATSEGLAISAGAQDLPKPTVLVTSRNFLGLCGALVIGAA